MSHMVKSFGTYGALKLSLLKGARGVAILSDVITLLLHGDLSCFASDGSAIKPQLSECALCLLGGAFSSHGADRELIFADASMLTHQFWRLFSRWGSHF